jgi:hypothetical protein
MTDVNDVEIFLEHHGVKGMHWGVHKARSSSVSKRSSNSSGKPSDHSKLKKTLIIGGAVLSVAAIAAGTAYVAKNGGLPISSLQSHNEPAAKKFSEDFIKKTVPVHNELTSPIHASRVKHNGFRFMMDGGLPDPLHEHDLAGFSSNSVYPVGPGEFRRYGTNSEKVAVAFHDPKGRTDASGRVIPHYVVIPKEHSEGINTFEDAKNKAWSLVQSNYDKQYEKDIQDHAKYYNS